MRILQEFVLSWMVDFIPDAIPRGSYELRAFNSFPRRSSISPELIFYSSFGLLSE
jgi:hypothetical protein